MKKIEIKSLDNVLLSYLRDVAHVNANDAQ